MTVAAAAPPPPDDERSALVPLLAMLAALPREALAELEAALGRRLQPLPSPAERRVVELGFLARLLHELRPPDTAAETSELAGRDEASSLPTGRGRRRAQRLSVPRLSRSVYEARQPVEAPDAPPADLLVRRYVTWTRTCRAAYGLLPDGRSLGPSNAWAQPLRGRPQPPRYTKDDIRTAVRRCAFDLGRVPSAGDFHEWSRERKRLARLRGDGEHTEGGHPLIPGIQPLYRLYKKAGSEANRWRAAVADAQLEEADLARARNKQLRLDEKKALPEPDPTVLLLPIGEAIEHAQLLGVSLDWLAGRAVRPGAPPAAGLAFDPVRLTEQRARRRVTERELREALHLQLGPWRRMLNGKLEPTLGQLSIVAQMLSISLDALVSPL